MTTSSDQTEASCKGSAGAGAGAGAYQSSPPSNIRNQSPGPSMVHGLLGRSKWLSLRESHCKKVHPAHPLSARRQSGKRDASRCSSMYIQYLSMLGVFCTKRLRYPATCATVMSPQNYPCSCERDAMRTPPPCDRGGVVRYDAVGSHSRTH